MQKATVQPFIIPANIPLRKQGAFCTEIITKYREELVPLRKQLSNSQTQKNHWEERAKYWQEKYKEKVKEIGIVKKEKEQLKKEIEKLTKTNNRYQVALFDHGNFTHPDTKDKKAKGGQIGHADTNREKQENYQNYEKKRVFAKACGRCGCSLKRVASSKKKILLDIVINPEIVKLIIESERQWCKTCQKAVIAKDPQTLPFTEYGINTFMLVMILRFKAHASIATIAAVIRVGYGLALTSSAVSNLLKMAGTYLDKKYQELKQAIRQGAIMYNDETGWLVHGQKAWMWIMTTPDKKDGNGEITEAGITVYVAAESRGKGIFAEMYGNSTAYSMHDGYASYEAITGEEKTLYCWTHVLRFAFEETVNLGAEHLASQIRDRLVDLYQAIRSQAEWSKEQKREKLREAIAGILAIQSEDETVKNIQYRVRTQKEGLILALLVTEDGTNNLSERELRNMAIKRTISHGSDTYKGMETTAIIGSVVQTLNRKKEAPYILTLQTYLTDGIREKYPQYIHTSYADS